jgi:hypothetical protein
MLFFKDMVDTCSAELGQTLEARMGVTLTGIENLI